MFILLKIPVFSQYIHTLRGVQVRTGQATVSWVSKNIYSLSRHPLLLKVSNIHPNLCKEEEKSSLSKSLSKLYCVHLCFSIAQAPMPSCFLFSKRSGIIYGAKWVGIEGERVLSNFVCPIFSILRPNLQVSG